MTAFRVFAGRLVGAVGDPFSTVLEIEEGRISRVRPLQTGESPGSGDVDARSYTVIPGMVDTHVHGGFGLDQMDGKVETVRRHAELLLERGVTAFLVTPLTAPWGQIRSVVAAARELARSHGIHARVLGCHLEGPFLHPEYRGAQNPEFLVPPDFGALSAALGPLIEEVRIVTLAPELPGAQETIRALVEAGVQVSIGHTGATFDQVVAAKDAGATRVTHCYNAMCGLHHREPGTVGAALALPELTAELIWDNVHVHPAVCRVLCQIKGPGKVIAVSDGTTGVGMVDGYAFDLWGLPVSIDRGAARLADGRLAGSTIGLDDALRNAAAELGLERAVEMCSTTPAASIGMAAEMGVLAPGRCADFVLLGKDNRVVATYLGGCEVYRTS